MKRGILSLLFLFLLTINVNAEYYPYEYPEYNQPTYWGYGGIGNFDFNSIYDRYSLFVDAIIFGFIFFGVGSLVFGQKVGYTPLYIGLGLFLTGSLLLYESRNTIKLLDIAGPWAVTVFVLIVALLVYRIIKDNLMDNALFAGAAAVITALWLLGELSSYLKVEFGVLSFLSGIMDSGWGIVIGGIVAISIIAVVVKKFGLKATK